jgi:membrane-associated phospholipid phosphatase
VSTSKCNYRSLITTATFLVFSIVSPMVLAADSAHQPADGTGLKDGVLDWTHDTARVGKQTFTNPRNLKILGVTALGSAALMFTNGDDEIRDMVDDVGFGSSLGDAGFVLGGYGPALLDLGLFAHGRLRDNDRSTEAGKVLASALAIDGITTGAMKIAIGRHRPSATNSSTEFDPFSFSNRSFPSGHMSWSFTTATVMAEMYDDKPWVKYAGYGTATLIGVARISDDSHWASDVLFGAVKGYLIGKTVTRMHKNRRMENMSIITDMSRDSNYVGLGFRF